MCAFCSKYIKHVGTAKLTSTQILLKIFTVSLAVKEGSSRFKVKEAIEVEPGVDVSHEAKICLDCLATFASLQSVQSWISCELIAFGACVLRSDDMLDG